MYRYEFDDDIHTGEIESSLLLSIMALESIHGEPQVRLDVAHVLDTDGRTCVIDSNTDVGRDLNRLFTGFLTKEFGQDRFTVKRIDQNEV